MPVRKISPLLDAMEIGACFSTHDGVSCYAITHPESGREFVLKYISVPAAQEQMEALLLTGAYASPEEADAYYRKEAEALVHEAEERKKLLDCPFILPFLGVQMEKKEEGVGYDVYAVLPKRNSLKDYLEENAISHLRGINMGIDLCAALEALREEGYVHGNLKPGNVYFSDTGRFLLGDFGLISTKDMQYTVLPEQYRSSYTAPELRNIIGGFNETVDIYSLGMILYRIYNGNHAPFEDEKTPSKAADTRRLEGDTLPAPLYADYELTEIIQKACAYDPADRYQTPAQMRIALERYMQRNAVSDQLIVPPLIAEDGPLNPEEREETVEPVRANDVESLDEDFKKEFAPDSKKKKKHKEKKQAQEEKPEAVDETPMLTAERRKTAEKAAKKRRRKRGAWIAFAVLMVLLVVGIGLYEFTDLGHGLYHYFVKVQSLEVSDVTSDAMNLHLKASVSEDQFRAICEDAYGNTVRSEFTDGTASFTGLKPGTQYTLRVELSGTHKLSGRTSVIASTVPQTEILTFTATPGAEKNAVQLDFVVKEGSPEPESWTLRYGKTGGAEEEITFTGHSTQIMNLESGTEYRFRLVGREHFYLIGQLETTYTTQREIYAEDLHLKQIQDGTAYIGWTCTSELPDAWTLTCADAEGKELPVTVNEATPQENIFFCSATVPDLAPGVAYTLTLNAEGLDQPLTLTVRDEVIALRDFTAEATQEGVTLSWSANREPEGGWQITGTYGDDLSLEETVDGDTVQIAVLPETEYSFTIRPVDGSEMTGEDTVSVQTPASVRYAERGVTYSGTTLGTYDLPQTENWSFANLGGGTVVYDPGDRIVFVVTTSGVPEDSGEQVSVHYVIRRADDTLVHVETDTLTWNEMWEGSRWMGVIPWLPDQAGSYSFQIYVDGRLIGKIPFTMR